jgi:hypothetical protein
MKGWSAVLASKASSRIFDLFHPARCMNMYSFEA